MHVSGFNRRSDSRTRSNMDLLSPAFRSLELGDVKPPKDNFLQVERNEVLEKNSDDEDARERRFKSSREKSRDELPTIDLDEVAWHDTPDDCWLVIYDYVYDCTEFLKNHPGGQDILLEYAGHDATLAFIGTGHSAVARKTLERYIIGELPPEERIFRIPDGVKVLGF
ncbi:PREDICTED: cytochrome b5 isoform X2 [Dinoponera quadriceps]|uniref:Cytochrome b5 isoform X2 n=1 Tax=Dinoponera quadriceps TaxID=609295 RepID=A0A6P3XN92_DINQU|nr:PREDICTED: cytochrome b5 isoform X2 [Dinoponera quadriceps]